MIDDRVPSGPRGNSSVNAAAPARTLTDIAAALGARLVGDGSIVVRRVAHPLMADAPDTLALAMEGGAEQALARTKAAVAAVAESGAAALAALKGGIVVKRPRYALAQLLQLFDVPPVSIVPVKSLSRWPQTPAKTRSPRVSSVM